MGECMFLRFSELLGTVEVLMTNCRSGDGNYDLLVSGDHTELPTCVCAGDAAGVSDE